MNGLVGLLLLFVASAIAQAAPSLRFRVYEVRDEQQGGLVLSRIMIPERWKATSKVVWNYGDVSLPVHAVARVESPDIQLNDAMKHFVLAPYRSKMPGFQVGASRPVSGLAARHLVRKPPAADVRPRRRRD